MRGFMLPRACLGRRSLPEQITSSPRGWAGFQNISQHKAQPRHSNVASLYLLIPAMHFPACSYYQILLSSSLLPSVVLSLYPSPLSFKVFFVIHLYITLFCSLCCPPSVSSLLCLVRSPPVSSSLYTALYRFTQILMIPPFFSFVFAC